MTTLTCNTNKAAYKSKEKKRKTQERMDLAHLLRAREGAGGCSGETTKRRHQVLRQNTFQRYHINSKHQIICYLSNHHLAHHSLKERSPRCRVGCRVCSVCRH